MEHNVTPEALAEVRMLAASIPAGSVRYTNDFVVALIDALTEERSEYTKMYEHKDEESGRAWKRVAELEAELAKWRAEPNG